jgi:two-component system response regulator
MEKYKIILLIEDNKQDELLTVRALQKHGIRHEVVVCRDGAEAIDWLTAKGQHSKRDFTLVPTVILLDLKLPKIGGLEVLSSIRNDIRTNRLPVVVLTTSKEESDIAQSY